MQIFTSIVPIWFSLIVLLFFPVLFFLIANTAKNAVLNAGFDPSKATKIYQNIFIFYGISSIYVVIMSFTGIFQQNTLPPRILLYTAIPLLLFYFWVFLKSELFQKLFTHTSLEALIRIHLFRFIGLFFIISYAYGALPKSFALVAGIGDILTAFGAIFVTKAVEQKKANATTLAFIWNVFGMIDMFSVVSTAVLATKKAIETNSQDLATISKFPFSWIPAFAPATFIFLHILIFKKLKEHK